MLVTWSGWMIPGCSGVLERWTTVIAGELVPSQVFIDLLHHSGNYCFDEGLVGLLSPGMFSRHRCGVPDSVLSRKLA